MTLQHPGDDVFFLDFKHALYASGVSFSLQGPRRASAEIDDAPPTGRVVVEDRLAYRNASWQLWRDHRVFVPFATIQNWVVAGGGERASERWESDYLDWALNNFSGYLAADELHDRQFCILPIGDNRTFKRLFFEVLDHDPNHEDMIAFFGCFQTVLQARQLTVKGITTDGSALYPTAIQVVWGNLPPQICEFHILKDLNQAILRAAAIAVAAQRGLLRNQ